MIREQPSAPGAHIASDKGKDKHTLHGVTVGKLAKMRACTEFHRSITFEYNGVFGLRKPLFPAILDVFDCNTHAQEIRSLAKALIMA